MKTLKSRYPIHQCALYKCRSRKKLESILKIQLGELKVIQDEIRYHSFEIAKKDSSEKRKISAPAHNLKAIQSRILFLIKRIERPNWLMSGEQGKCYITNGKAHIHSNYFLTMDIKKFYENCHREGVYHFFLCVLKTSPDVAKILTDIVTYEGGIPTGCPTSQLIAFYAYEEMFNEIKACAQSHSCIFTLYVDDMTFSSVEPFSKDKLTREVDIILRKYGHKPKYKKVRYYSADDSKPVTGTIITPSHDLEVPNSLQKKIKENFSLLVGVNGEKISEEEKYKQSQTIIGQINAARSIDAANGNSHVRFPEMERLTHMQMKCIKQK